MVRASMTAAPLLKKHRARSAWPMILAMLGCVAVVLGSVVVLVEFELVVVVEAVVVLVAAVVVDEGVVVAVVVDAVTLWLSLS